MMGYNGKEINMENNIEEYKTKEYKGKKNESEYPYLVSLLQTSQATLKKYLIDATTKIYGEDNVLFGDGYVYIKGDIPVCLTAHMDTTPTVGKDKRMPVIDYYEQTKEIDGRECHILSSPQGIGGDDRCGIWSIMTIITQTEYRPYIVFCEDEEIGCVGSGKFCETELINCLKDCKYIIEIDRRGNNDAVFYDDDNYEWHRFVEETTGYTEAYGSCSDICNLSKASGVASVNLSSGYYDEHTINEYIIIEETIDTMRAVIKLLDAAINEDTPYYKYEEKIYRGFLSRYYKGSWYDDDDDKYVYGKEETDDYENIPISSLTDIGIVVGYFVIIDLFTYEQLEVRIEGESKYACVAKLFMTYTDLCWDNVVSYEFADEK